MPRGTAAGFFVFLFFLIMNTPSRLYYFSDAYGGHRLPDPLRDPDADALISTDFGSANDRPVQREFDTFGQEAVTDHILRLVVHQHDEFAKRTDLSRRKKREFLQAGTGVFINSAPRIDHSNAEPFQVASLRGGAIKVVATPLSALTAIRGDVEDLSYLPNPQSETEQNGLYGHREQFRSRLAPTLLRNDSRLPLVSQDPGKIPTYAKAWHVAYVDRYGNIITWVKDVEAQWNEITQIADRIGDTRAQVQFSISGRSRFATQAVTLGTSLGEGDPGQLSVYRNGNIDLVRKWSPADTAESKLRSSAYELFERPVIGDEIQVAPSQVY